jgi:hypothetical protein
MARGEHPERTPVYGGLLAVAALIAATAVTVWSTPLAVRIVVYVIGGIAATVGFLMTFRDYT